MKLTKMLKILNTPKTRHLQRKIVNVRGEIIVHPTNFVDSAFRPYPTLYRRRTSFVKVGSWLCSSVALLHSSVYDISNLLLIAPGISRLRRVSDIKEVLAKRS